MWPSPEQFCKRILCVRDMQIKDSNKAIELLEKAIATLRKS